MNRRGFFKAVMAGTATVMIGMKMASAFPTPVFSGRLRSEKVGPYKYYMNLDDPLDVSVYFADDNGHRNPLPIKRVNEWAQTEYDAVNKYKLRAGDADVDNFTWRTRRTNTQYDVIDHDIDTSVLELCAVVGMSQGMAQHNLNGGMGISQYADGTMDYAEIPLAQIKT